MSTTTFAQLLKALLNREGITQRAFANLAECSESFVSQVLHGTSRIGVDNAEQWVEVLELTAQERQIFLYLAGLEHLPEPMRQSSLELCFKTRMLQDAIKELKISIDDLQ
jgi:transcriptional regulator with XRE-family HTH domain